MNGVIATNELHDALGAYVVGALETPEREAFARHLTTCAGCREEVVALEETAARLSVLVAAPSPPTALRTALLTTIPEVPQLPARPRTPVDLPQRRSRARGARRHDRRTRVLTLLVAAVSVLALGLGGVVHSLSAHQQTPAAGAPADASLLAAPDARLVPATLPDGTNVSFVVSRSQNRAEFVAADLPDPGPGLTYQLWLMRRGVAVPDSTVDGGSDVSAWFHGSVSSSEGLALTVEPDGGSHAPTPPVLASART